MLETALSIYFEGKDYFSPLHLAGASEEIFGKCLEMKGIKNSLESEKEGFILINKKMFGREVSPKEAGVFLNRVKNAIKHMNKENDTNVVMDPKDDAEAMLDRAITNLWRLEEEISPLMEKFWNRNIRNE